jgi:hypothetical protein
VASVAEASQRFAVPERWIFTVMHVETIGSSERDHQRRQGTDADHAWNGPSCGLAIALNAGPGRSERHLATGQPLPEETQSYVATLEPMIDPAVYIDALESPLAGAILVAPGRGWTVLFASSVRLAFSKGLADTLVVSAAAARSMRVRRGTRRLGPT